MINITLSGFLLMTERSIKAAKRGSCREGVFVLNFKQGVFTSWRDTKVFDSVRIGSSGELVWGEQIDLCPDSLYLKVTGKTANEVFPDLCDSASHA